MPVAKARARHPPQRWIGSLLLHDTNSSRPRSSPRRHGRPPRKRRRPRSPDWTSSGSQPTPQPPVVPASTSVARRRMRCTALDPHQLTCLYHCGGVSASSHASLRAIAPGVSFLASAAGGGALILRLSQGEELRADRQAAELLGSAGPVIAMLEQVRADYRALGIDSDRWRRRTGCLPPTHPSRSVSGRWADRPSAAAPTRGPSSHALAREDSPASWRTRIGLTAPPTAVVNGVGRRPTGRRPTGTHAAANITQDAAERPVSRTSTGRCQHNG